MSEALCRALGMTWRVPEPAVAAFDKIFGGGSPELPPVPKVQPIPDLADPAILQAKRRAQTATTRSGREATILSGAQAGDYSGSKLGIP